MSESGRDHERVAELEAQLERARVEIEQLRAALASARTIGAAMGIIMAGRKITQAHAFELLSRASQNQNAKVRDVADEVVATGVLPAVENVPEPAG